MVRIRNVIRQDDCGAWQDECGCRLLSSELYAEQEFLNQHTEDVLKREVTLLNIHRYGRWNDN